MTSRAALAALVLGSLLAGCGIGGSATIGAPVTVYLSLPLTGPRSVDGRDAADGARLALERAGGRAGSIQVRARYLDDARGKPWDPVAVGENARMAVQDSSAAGYIGELDSEPTRASVPITNDAGLVQISPGAGAVDLTSPAAGYPNSPDRYQPSGSPNFARTVPSDSVVADAAASWASELRMVAVLARSDGSPYQSLMAEEFSTAAREHGIQVQIARGSAPAPAADGVYSPGSPSSAGAQTLQPAGTASQLQVAAEVAPANLPDRAFPGEFAKRFHHSPGPYAAYGYAAMDLLLRSVQGAGTDASSFRDKVRNGVFGAHLDGTVLGSYAITDQGDTTECMVQRYRIQGGAGAPLGAPCPQR